jgi:putative ABC transport system permease protein
VLFGLKFGVIDTFAQRLIEDPRNREIGTAGSGRFDDAFFARVRAWPEVAFLVPNTRSIAASFALVREPTTRTSIPGLQMVPTAAGDPLLAGIPGRSPTGLSEVALSDAAARELGVGAGGQIEAVVQRRAGGAQESAMVRLTVTAVAPEAAMPMAAAFVPLELLVATEDWRDGYAVDALGWGGQPLPGQPRTYARFRLYAASIYDVAALGGRIAAEGVEVRTKAAEIEAVQLLDRNLDRVFWLIAGSAIVGFLASLAANLLANVERKRKELSILRLIGFSTASIVAFPMVQAALTAVLGGALAVVVAHGLGATLNGLFASSLRPGEEICRLLPQHIAASLAGTLLAAMLASAWAGLRASRIEPAEGIRDV